MHLWPFHPWRSRLAPGLRAARRGVAALEFALTVPVLVFMMLGMYDLSVGWITRQRLITSSSSVGQVATMVAWRPLLGLNWLSSAQAWQAATAINAAMPETRLSDAQYTVVMSEILFIPDIIPNPSCSKPGQGALLGYCAYVLWSKVVLSNGNAVLQRRPCGLQQLLQNTAPPSQAGLPEGAFQASPLLVVDVAYTYKPVFLSSLFGSFPMTHAVYYPSRSGDATTGVDQLIGYGDLTDSKGTLLPDGDAYCPSIPSIPS